MLCYIRVLYNININLYYLQKFTLSSRVNQLLLGRALENICIFYNASIEKLSL